MVRFCGLLWRFMSQALSERFHLFFLKAFLVCFRGRLRPHSVGTRSKVILLSVRVIDSTTKRIRSFWRTERAGSFSLRFTICDFSLTRSRSAGHPLCVLCVLSRLVNSCVSCVWRLKSSLQFPPAISHAPPPGASGAAGLPVLSRKSRRAIQAKKA